MTFVCLWIPSWSTDAASIAETPATLSASTPPMPPPDQLIEALLQVAPRVAMGARGLLWADARGLSEHALADALCSIVRAQGASRVQAGVARTAIAAEVAATAALRSTALSSGEREADSIADSTRDSIIVVPSGEDRAFLAAYPLRVLRTGADSDPDPKLLSLLALLAGVGIETCGQLAALGQEEIEVRCGMEGVRLWRLARADDRRRPFGAQPRTMPRASCAWTDYALRDGERLLFVINRLVGHVCDVLQSRGEGARELLLHIALASRAVVDHPLRAAHPTADRSAWLRLARTALETLRLPDAVTGITVQVRAVVPLIDQQGDVFDRGFATARATEQAVAQLLDTCGADAVALTLTDHPLLERRAQWLVREPVVLDTAYAVSQHAPARSRMRKSAGAPPHASAHSPALIPADTPTTIPTSVPTSISASASASRPSLTLQLLPEPQRVRVITVSRRDHAVPVRYHEPPPATLTGAARGGSRNGSRNGLHNGSRDGSHGGSHGDGRALHGGTAVEILIAVGPDRVEGGSWEAAPYAREYFHCVTSAGRLVLLFHAADGWYLHGWWD
jgi:hypothetical protein